MRTCLTLSRPPTSDHERPPEEEEAVPFEPLPLPSPAAAPAPQDSSQAAEQSALWRKKLDAGWQWHHLPSVSLVESRDAETQTAEKCRPR